MQINCKHVCSISWYFDGNPIASECYESGSINLDDMLITTIDVDGYKDMYLKEAVLGKDVSIDDDDYVLELKFVKELGLRGRLEIRSNLYASDHVLAFVYFEVAHLDDMCDLKRKLEDG